MFDIISSSESLLTRRFLETSSITCLRVTFMVTFCFLRIFFLRLLASRRRRRESMSSVYSPLVCVVREMWKWSSSSMLVEASDLRRLPVGHLLKLLNRDSSVYSASFSRMTTSHVFFGAFISI